MKKTLLAFLVILLLIETVIILYENFYVENVSKSIKIKNKKAIEANEKITTLTASSTADESIFIKDTPFVRIRSHRDSLAKGAILVPGVGVIRLLNMSGALLHDWRISADYQIFGPRLLSGGSIVFSSPEKGGSIKSIDIDGHLRWSISKIGDLIQPFLWTIDKDENIYFAINSANDCPQIIRRDRIKSETWMVSVPQKYCKKKLRRPPRGEGIHGIMNIQYAPKFSSTGKSALVIATESLAAVIDIESKKIVWKYEEHGNGSLYMFKLSSDGRSGWIMRRDALYLWISFTDFDNEKKSKEWQRIMLFDMKADYFDLGKKHILLSDGKGRLIEVAISEQGSENKTMLSFSLGHEFPFFSMVGSEYIYSIPEYFK